MTKKLSVCIPTRGDVNGFSFDSLMRFSAQTSAYWYHRYGREGEFRMRTMARSHIVDARNGMLEASLKDPSDYIVWIDDDMIVPPDFASRMIGHLEAHPEIDYVGGIAYKKAEPFSPCAFCERLDDEGAGFWVTRKPYRLQEVTVTGFACIAGRGSSFRKVADITNGAPFIYKHGVGEDRAFCYHARSIGQRIFVDTGCMVGHVGPFVFDEAMYQGTLALEKYKHLAKFAQPVDESRIVNGMLSLPQGCTDLDAQRILSTANA